MVIKNSKSIAELEDMSSYSNDHLIGKVVAAGTKFIYLEGYFSGTDNLSVKKINKRRLNCPDLYIFTGKKIYKEDLIN